MHILEIILQVLKRQMAEWFQRRLVFREKKIHRSFHRYGTTKQWHDAVEFIITGNERALYNQAVNK